MTIRDHEAVNITEFNGLWARGDKESCPLDHFTDCDNLKYIQSGFATRDGLNIINGAPGIPVAEMVRIYVYVHQDQESLLGLDTTGNIHHIIPNVSDTIVLTVAGMTDFTMLNVAGRAYISPSNGITGLENEFLYVYFGDGNPARKAAGLKPVGNTYTATLVFPGHVEAGVHVFGVVYETNSGFLTAIGPDILPTVIGTNTHAVELTNIPVSGQPFVVARHIVVTKAINPTVYTGNTLGYQFFFVPDGRIPDNTTTTFTVDFFDADLLEDASHLLDNFEEIPAFVNLTTYHNRLVGVGEWGDPTDDEDFIKTSTARVSAIGEPEAISQVDGLIVAPLDGNPLTNCQEYRDVLYLFKNTRTYSYNDNGDVPSSWPGVTIDQGTGCGVHGIATVLDSGGINIEFLLLANYSGLVMFNGSFIRPELTWKIQDLWLGLVPQNNDEAREEFIQVQVMNDTISKRIYITLPDYSIMYADYADGLDPKNIKFCPWTFPNSVTTIALMDITKLIIGSRVVVP